jgi:uncharacterized integral membrane protein
MAYVKTALGLLLLVAILVFAFQNIASVDVSFLFWSFRAPKILLILGTYVLGMLSGWGLIGLLKKVF